MKTIESYRELYQHLVSVWVSHRKIGLATPFTAVGSTILNELNRVGYQHESGDNTQLTHQYHAQIELALTTIYLCYPELRESLEFSSSHIPADTAYFERLLREYGLAFHVAQVNTVQGNIPEGVVLTTSTHFLLDENYRFVTSATLTRSLEFAKQLVTQDYTGAEDALTAGLVSLRENCWHSRRGLFGILGIAETSRELNYLRYMTGGMSLIDIQPRVRHNFVEAAFFVRGTKDANAGIRGGIYHQVSKLVNLQQCRTALATAEYLTRIGKVPYYEDGDILGQSNAAYSDHVANVRKALIPFKSSSGVATYLALYEASAYSADTPTPSTEALTAEYCWARGLI